MAEKKQIWKPGNMLYPLPAVMVSLRDGEGRDNILTVAWTGTVCTNPAMLYISVRPERYSYRALRERGQFVVNLTTEELAWATDYCGVTSGRDVDKFAACHLTREEAVRIDAPMIGESPVNIECRVTEVLELGSHHMFLAKVEAVHASEKYMMRPEDLPWRGRSPSLTPTALTICWGGSWEPSAIREEEKETLEKGCH